VETVVSVDLEHALDLARDCARAETPLFENENWYILAKALVTVWPVVEAAQEFHAAETAEASNAWRLLDRLRDALDALPAKEKT
jgi:hypothetical protein